MDHGIYVYPWDLADEGPAAAFASIAGGGFRSVHIASAYHAGRFLLPHNPRGKVRFAEDGAVFFRPSPDRFGRLSPRVGSIVAEDGEVGALFRAATAAGLNPVAWIVGAHNTWLGERHPDVTVENAFGDRYLHSLSVAHPEVRAYLVGLVSDVAALGPSAIELESFGHLGFRHGFHHEITGVLLDTAEEALLALAFGPAELAAAEDSGVDGTAIRERVAGTLLRGWDGPPARAAAAAQALLASDEVAAYVGVLYGLQATLLAEVGSAVHAVAPTTRVRQILPAPDSVVRAAAPHLDGVIAPYPRRLADIAGTLAHLGALGVRDVRGGYRALAPLRVSVRSAAQTLAAWSEAGASGVNVYNYGLMTPHTFLCLADAIREGA